MKDFFYKVWHNKEVRSWGIILAVIGLLYLTGWHTEVFGRMQQAVLYTGLFNADSETEVYTHEQSSIYFPLKKLNGGETNLAEFEGKTLFINFWATWCPPCVAEMPNIQDLYNDLKSHPDIEFVMVSLDDDPQKAREFIDRKEFTFPVYTLSEGVPPQFQTSTIPTTFVVNPRGQIVVRKRGMAYYNTDKFRQLLTKW